MPENNLHISVKYFVLTKDKERIPLCKATFITIFGEYEKEKKRENHAQYLINKQNVGFLSILFGDFYYNILMLTATSFL